MRDAAGDRRPDECERRDRGAQRHDEAEMSTRGWTDG
jgi:hypothetical protein